MARAWFVRDSAWQVLPVESELLLSGCADEPVAAAANSAIARVVALAGAMEPIWVLQARDGASVRINGAEIPGGLAVLSDRDSLQVGAASLVLSTAMSPVIAQYSGAAVSCPRCRRQVSGPAVICPRCKSVYHQAADSGCWLYSTHCQICQHPTSLEQEQWRPEEV